MEKLTYASKDGVAILSLDDGKANALGDQTWAELNAALDKAEKEDAIVIITGRDGMMSGGFDLNEMNAGPEESLLLTSKGSIDPLDVNNSDSSGPAFISLRSNPPLIMPSRPVIITMASSFSALSSAAFSSAHVWSPSALALPSSSERMATPSLDAYVSFSILLS